MAAIAELARTRSIWKRVGNYHIPNAVVFWFCVAFMIAAIVSGFTWGGWVTGATATARADKAAHIASNEGQAKLAATICADRFITGPQAYAQAALLRATASTQRNEFIRNGGWLALPGLKDPVSGAADLCVQRILSTMPSSD